MAHVQHDAQRPTSWQAGNKGTLEVAIHSPAKLLATWI
jgi:hypothetical protein